MADTIAIERAISTFANTLRLYSESCLRFGALFKVDREEAINNLDRAFEAKLEAFHTLYDVSKDIFPYFDHGDTALLIAVRNGIHHRNHPLFRSLYSRIFLEEKLSRWVGASFLIASYSARARAPSQISHCFRLDDFYARLDPSFSSPYLDKMSKPEKLRKNFILIERQLGFAIIREKGAKERYPGDQIYLDLLPIFRSAVSRVFKMMKEVGIAFKGYDANVYMKHFTSDIEINLSNPTFTVSRIA